MFNPIALRKAKIVYSFGLFECSRVKKTDKYHFFADLVDRMSDVKTSLDDTVIKSADSVDRADQISEKVDKEMMPKIRELQEIHSADFEDIDITCKASFLLMYKV